MYVEHLRALRDANPFQPFTIHMADGWSHRVIHRDYLSLSPGGRTVIAYHGDEACSFVDMLLVTEISVDAPSASVAARADSAA